MNNRELKIAVLCFLVMLSTALTAQDFGNNSKVGKYANVNGIKLYYEIYGTGAPLVMLHGNGSSIATAAPLYASLMKKYKVIAIDSRAHGKSTDTNAPLTYEQMVSDVNALLNELKIDSAYIFGHSDGAIEGILLARDYPKKVKRVIAYAANLQPDTTALHDWVLKGIQKWRDSAETPNAKKLSQMMLDYPHISYKSLESIKAPILVMCGDRDVIRLEHTVKIFQHLPKSQLCVLPGATHMGALEKQELFLKLLDSFFTAPFAMPDNKSWF